EHRQKSTTSHSESGAKRWNMAQSRSQGTRAAQGRVRCQRVIRTRPTLVRIRDSARESCRVGGTAATTRLPGRHFDPCRDPKWTELLLCVRKRERADKSCEHGERVTCRSIP